MEEPGSTWEFWKFGMKQQDLTTVLQAQYNTFPSSIQDPEAFHRDVFEMTRMASTMEEFHQLMADRKQHRIGELNATLESISLEIIANPSLISTEQWQFAVQLFRAQSLDALVRYFASYLLDDNPSLSHVSVAGTSNGADHVSNSQASSFIDNGPILTQEPLSVANYIVTDRLGPSSF